MHLRPLLSGRDIFRRYAKAPRSTRLYLYIKLRICPYLAIESRFPKRGRIVDLGCGNGVFSNILSMSSPERSILGFDFDEKKLEAAKSVHGTIHGLEFRSGNIVAMDYPPSDVYSIIDVLYLIPFETQEHVLRKIHAALPPGGTLMLKDMDTYPGWKSVWNSLEETLAVNILGYTLGKGLFYRSAQDYVGLLEAIGFDVETVRLDKGYWYPHILFVCRKKGEDPGTPRAFTPTPY